jgi:SAM-dependent methyltransferase
MTKVFSDYARYYDLLYKDKDYEKEVDYLNSLITKFSDNKNFQILDIGCGTGRHASLLSKYGYHVTGIDVSEEMIRVAEANKVENTEFSVQNAAKFNLKRKFDVVLSLFHVISYQTSNEIVEKVFTNVSGHLVEKGIFIFDFWYGPAVLTEKPSSRIKSLEDDEIKVFRFANPDLHINENVVDVNYELIIYNKIRKHTGFIKETHSMRYFFQPEIDFYLEKCHMKPLHYEEWLTGKGHSSATWGVCCIAMKM